ncbi:MAG: hypothetical protein H6R17_4349 [Proteobacteria bacterium]|nr:hypothetical protein [Pseudomonadota bacterium]
MTSVNPAGEATFDESFPNPGDFHRAVATMCGRVPVSAGAAGLAKDLARLSPRLFFRDVLSRGGWYRLGSVIDAQGDRVADDLVRWLESELALRGDDLHALVDDYAESGLRATRLTGKTHYLVASTGSLADEFLQVEIEELQEVVSHELFAGELPGGLEELAAPPRAGSGKGPVVPLGAPFYALRRVTDVADFLWRMAQQKPEAQNVQRFVDSWQSSSAGSATTFSNHWVLAVREYLDRFRQPILQATPVAAVNGLPAKFDSVYGARGLALYEALQRFDRAMGYPMAWFFHMLTTKVVPYAVANAVVDDVQSGFSYLPERDVTVIKDWLHRPYGF